MTKVRYRLNGREVTPAEFDAHPCCGDSGPPMVSHAYDSARPLVSEGLGCMEHQVPEMREAVKRAGLSAVRVLDSGAVELSARGDAGRRGLLRLRGFRDNDGGYSDG